MHESFMLFESISNSPWFIRTALILFLNKMDLFKAKLENSPIPQYFPDFVGDHTNLKTAATFFQDKLENLNRNSQQVCHYILQQMSVMTFSLTLAGGLHPFHQCYR